MSDAADWRLSKWSVAQTDFGGIDGVFALIVDADRTNSAVARGAPVPLTPKEIENARRAFLVVKEEFDRTLGWTSKAMRWVSVGIFIAIGLSVAGGALVQLSPWAGLITVASVSSLFALLPKAFALARDQAMLQLIPSRYLLALELCRTRDDLQTLMKRFLDESSSQRTPRGGKSMAG